MATDAQSIPKPGQAPKRRLRNYLLDARFQLKYTGMVVAVTVIVTGLVGGWLGREAYEHSTGMTQMLLMQRGGGGMEVTDDMQQLFEEEARESDAAMLRQIVTGIVALVLILAVALGLTGIVVTHRVVGPAYKLKLLLGDVANGSLNTRGGLRKGDELQDVGEAFKEMVVALRQRREDELAQLERALTKAEKAAEDPDEDVVVGELRALRDRLRATLEA